jgi:hypothetical protein
MLFCMKLPEQGHYYAGPRHAGGPREYPEVQSPCEHALPAHEIQALGADFRSYRAVFGRLVLAQPGVKYVLQRQTGGAFAAARSLDNGFHRLCLPCRRWSYYQILATERESPAAIW